MMICSMIVLKIVLWIYMLVSLQSRTPNDFHRLSTANM